MQNTELWIKKKYWIYVEGVIQAAFGNGNWFWEYINWHPNFDLISNNKKNQSLKLNLQMKNKANTLPSYFKTSMYIFYLFIILTLTHFLNTMVVFFFYLFLFIIFKIMLNTIERSWNHWISCFVQILQFATEFEHYHLVKSPSTYHNSEYFLRNISFYLLKDHSKWF